MGSCPFTRAPCGLKHTAVTFLSLPKDKKTAGENNLLEKRWYEYFITHLKSNRSSLMGCQSHQGLHISICRGQRPRAEPRGLCTHLQESPARSSPAARGSPATRRGWTCSWPYRWLYRLRGEQASSCLRPPPLSPPRPPPTLSLRAVPGFYDSQLSSCPTSINPWMTTI